jgi:glyceraldehyde-3-phosphate dehydrogenase (NADP+)
LGHGAVGTTVVSVSTAIAELFPTTETLPADVRVSPDDHPPRYLIDGRVHRHDGEAQPVRSRVARRTDSGLEDVLVGHEAQLTPTMAEEAMDAAVRAWGKGAGPWPSASPEERIGAIEKLASAIEAHADRVATLLMFEIGKPRASARKEVTRSVAYIRDTIGVYREMLTSAGKTFTGNKGSTVHYARESREPLGIVLCVAPFNYPVNEFLTTVVPALLMGNVVVGKTPRFGMLANMVLADAFAEHLPAGAVSLLPGDGRKVIPAVMKSAYRNADGKEIRGKVDMLAFIGSERAAEAILDHHPSPFTLHKVLGLGSKNAAMMLEGADVDEVAAGTVGGALGFNGQRCTAEKLFFAPKARAEALAEALASKVDDLVVGMPWDEDVAITPLPERDKLAWMRAYIDDALDKGARIINRDGGEGTHSLMRPAVLYPVDARMRIYHEEQFGPIVPVAAYDDAAEVVTWQREAPFGQQVGLWGPGATELASAFRPLVARINLDDKCQRGPDSFGFTATDKSGFGILSLHDALITFSRPVLVQSRNPSLVG